jgi:hypothetical protein
MGPWALSVSFRLPTDPARLKMVARLLTLPPSSATRRFVLLPVCSPTHRRRHKCTPSTKLTAPEVVRLLAAVSMRNTNGRIRPDPATLGAFLRVVSSFRLFCSLLSRRACPIDLHSLTWKAPPLSEKSETDVTLRRPDSGGVSVKLAPMWLCQCVFAAYDGPTHVARRHIAALEA